MENMLNLMFLGIEDAVAVAPSIRELLKIKFDAVIAYDKRVKAAIATGDLTVALFNEMTRCCINTYETNWSLNESIDPKVVDIFKHIHNNNESVWHQKIVSCIENGTLTKAIWYKELKDLMYRSVSHAIRSYIPHTLNKIDSKLKGLSDGLLD